YDPSGYLCVKKINQYNRKAKKFKGNRADYLRNKLGDKYENYKELRKKNPKLSASDAHDIVKWQDYFDDIESQTNLKIQAKQKLKIIEELKNNKHKKKLPDDKKSKHRTDFGRKKNDLIKQWEKETGQKWPVYDKDIMSKDGKTPLRDKGDKFDAHEIIPNSYDSPLEWWNIHPASVGRQHQGGIHRAKSPFRKIFTRRKS
ncbi:MAG: hypothetical protein IJH34_00760, partial [Romboutsia sp.]|nr:hypothetical protein [Romboutsia sp.]